MAYDTEQFKKSDYEKLDMAGEYTATVKICKLQKNEANEDQFLVGFVAGDSIHFERFTMNERFGWLFSKMLTSMGLGQSQRARFEPEMILNKQYVINIVTNDKGFLRLDTIRPVQINNHLRPDPKPNSDVPF